MTKDPISVLVPEIRAAAPDLPLERVEAIAIGIWRDCGGSVPVGKDRRHADADGKPA